jgi:hypothetical protein
LTSFSIEHPEKNSSYTVRAVDLQGNESAPSKPITF